MTPAFKAHLRATFAPVLREHGFRGTGKMFRRVTGVVIQVLSIQGSRSGDSCCINLGTHLTFLPTVMEDPADPATITEPDCEFRGRLTPDASGDHWWWYGRSDDDAARSVASLLATYVTVGVPFLERYRTFPGPFDTMTPSILDRGDLSNLPGRTTKARAALAMARISLHRSAFDTAREFVRLGLSDLDSTPVAAIGIRRQLDTIASLVGERAG